MDPPEKRRLSPWAMAGSGYGQGLTILVELAAIIAGCAYLGYRLDRLFGTKPVLFAVLMVVGYAGGVLHVWVWARARSGTKGDERDGR